MLCFPWVLQVTACLVVHNTALTQPIRCVNISFPDPFFLFQFYVNDQDKLQVDRLSRDDKDLRFSCLASDDASNDRLDEPLSEPSSFYTVVPECERSFIVSPETCRSVELHIVALLQICKLTLRIDFTINFSISLSSSKLLHGERKLFPC